MNQPTASKGYGRKSAGVFATLDAIGMCGPAKFLHYSSYNSAKPPMSNVVVKTRVPQLIQGDRWE